jgi:hypothetical protein
MFSVWLEKDLLVIENWHHNPAIFSPEFPSPVSKLFNEWEIAEVIADGGLLPVGTKFKTKPMDGYIDYTSAKACLWADQPARPEDRVRICRPSPVPKAIAIRQSEVASRIASQEERLAKLEELLAK